MFFLVGGLEALLIRVQLASSGNTVVSAEAYNELFTMHGTTMVFMAVMPLSAAFFNFVVPECNSISIVGISCIYIYCIAFYPKHTSLKLNLVARIQSSNKAS